MRHGVFRREELGRIWSEGRRYGLFRATDFTAAGFWGRYLMQSVYLHGVEFGRLKLALLAPVSLAQWDVQMMRLERNRGQMLRHIADYEEDDDFFKEKLNGAFTSPFLPHPTEDYYQKKMAALAAERKIKFFVGSLPVAESAMGDKNTEFRRGRREHLEKLFAGDRNVYLLNFPETLPRENFFDFTHPNAKGSKILTAILGNQLRDLCAL